MKKKFIIINIHDFYDIFHNYEKKIYNYKHL